MCIQSPHEDPVMDALIDRFSRAVTYLRISVTDRCNFRCVYCMPAEGVPHQPRSALLSFEEITRVARVFARMGVQRIRLTGGDPTLRRNLPDLVASLAALPGIDEVVMTTNAFLLDRLASPLHQAGLAGLNISLDTLDPERFKTLTRVGSLERVERGIEAARAAGFERIKLNAVVIRGFNDDEILPLFRWAAERDLILRYIEFMPIGSDDTVWGQRGCFSAAEIRSRIASAYALNPLGRPNARMGPARYWRATGPDLPEGGARFGIIGAVTECFCDDCNRVRITPEGGLRVCLADDGEVNLRMLLRSGASDDTLQATIQEALLYKKESHSFALGTEQGKTARIMSTIGG